MPPQSIALYARWWQLETWLRELVYVELRALLGSALAEPVKVAVKRQQLDAAFTHMTGVDNDNPLAYLDYSQLIDIISQHWDQFDDTLLERRAWEGRQVELKQIRHRIGHLRAPHPDDLGRLEQMLRDLERGTFIALASYNRRRRPDRDLNDPVTAGWIRGKHDDATRLIDHADQQYETRLDVSLSKRPWADGQDNPYEAPGFFWHAAFFLRGRGIRDARVLWHDSYVKAVRPLIVHMLTDDPSQVEFTFSAVDDGDAVADAIGNVFEAVLMNSEHRDFTGGMNASLDANDRWQARARTVDYRVLAASGWSIVGDDTIPINSFGAGGGVQSLPSWPRG